MTTPRGEVRYDEGINGEITAGGAGRQAAAFRKDGTVTGGNSSPLNDGAAALLLMSEDAVRRAGCGRWRGTWAPRRPECTPTTWGSGRCPP